MSPEIRIEVDIESYVAQMDLLKLGGGEGENLGLMVIPVEKQSNEEVGDVMAEQEESEVEEVSRALSSIGGQ